MKTKFLSLLAALPILATVFSSPVQATQTENNVLHILPAPGPVKIDGKADDWDLSGGIFACDDVERLRDIYSVWFFAMYDKDNLYLLAKWKDSTPLNNPQSSKGGHGFAGDCLQVRFITHYKTPDEETSHWMGWMDRDKINVLSTQYGRDFKGLALDNALNNGAQQAFRVDDDGKGYTQEIAIPWKLLTKDGQPLQPGDSLRMAIEPNFTMEGLWGRLNIHDIFREGVVPDRVFTFRAYDQWGEGILEKQGHMTPPPVRLSDERQFNVQQVAQANLESSAKPGPAWPFVDWTGLIVKHELPGFKTITFNNPADGDVSLNIFNSDGDVARQLLTENAYDKGTHEVKWDGLTTPHYKTPGEPVPAGTYTWAGISHPPFKLTLRGWADNGGATPWENGPTTHWGGDHGVPTALATDGSKIFIGWGYAEAGKGLLATDLDGHVVWKVGSGLCDSNIHLAVDGDRLFSESINGEIVRLRTADGVFDNWDGLPSAALEIPQIWVGKPDADTWPHVAQGMEAKNGKLYLAFSSQSFYPSQLTDLKGFVTKLTSGDPVDARILATIDPRYTTQLAGYLAGKVPEDHLTKAGPGNPGFLDTAIASLNKLLQAPDLAPGTDAMSPVARAAANRKFLEANFAGCFKTPQTNFIAICDDKSGKLLKTLPADQPTAIHLLHDGRLAFISGDTSLDTIDPDSGSIKPLITGLDDAANFTSDADGKIYISEQGKTQQVKIFTADGQPAGSVGKLGGRQLTGLWQPDGMYTPTALIVDDKNKHLWVTESDKYPKRVSEWSLPDGKLVNDFYGATHYGASGGAIDPLDPNVMVGIGCEWKLDPTTGHASIVGIFDRDDHGFATFCPASNGKLYVAVVFEVGHYRPGLRVFERISPGIYKLRSEWRPDYENNTTTVWSDVNGDGKQDPDEVKTLPYIVNLAGSNSWSLNMNPNDFTLFAYVMNTPPKLVPHQPAPKPAPGAPLGKLLRINPDGFTACGAPKWDLDGMENLDYAWTNDFIAGEGHGSYLPSKNNRYLFICGGDNFYGIDLKKKKVIWTYPNTFPQVHGSHAAPPPVPGLTRGAYGTIGTFDTPQTGNVWVINGNCGEWYMINDKGYYLGHIFQGDVMKMHYPAEAVPGADMTNAPSGSGGEDFGGSVTQGSDGHVYIEAGKTAFWNVEMTGFDQVVPIEGGEITIAPSDIELAQKEQESQMQAAVGSLMLTAPHATVTFTGNLQKDFTAPAIVKYSKGPETAIQSAAAWDDTTLYLGWDVTDERPWVNGATDPAQMYVSGDTADFQFGINPKADPKRNSAVAGDFRVSIGNFQGKPTAVIYRPVSDVKKPRDFNSGVIKDYKVDYVDVLSQAQIKVTPRPGNKGYIIEAAIPFSALGFTPQPNVKYQGDFGVTYGNEAASRTRLRVYWSNQETGLVDDAVFELQMTPKNWGDIVFAK